MVCGSCYVVKQINPAQLPPKKGNLLETHNTGAAGGLFRIFFNVVSYSSNEAHPPPHPKKIIKTLIQVGGTELNAKMCHQHSAELLGT